MYGFLSHFVDNISNEPELFILFIYLILFYLFFYYYFFFYIQLNGFTKFYQIRIILFIAQSAWAVEYTDCTSAEG